MLHKLFRSLFVLIFVIGLVAIQAPQPARAAGPWYVSNTGDDINDCLSPATPCATINGAIGKAFSGDTIYVADGTYTGTGNAVVLIDKDITLSGGWNNTFTTLSGMSSIDGQEERRGILVFFNRNVTVEKFVIQGGNIGYGGGIQNAGNIIINTSIIINNTAEEGGGIANSRNMTLNSSFVSNNISTIGGGGGILNDFASTLTINNSTISENSSPGSIVNNRGGGGIYNKLDSLVAINNSTVSGNVNAVRGGGIYNNGGTITTNNSTISNNTAMIGGGIYNDSGSADVTLKNTILAENIASSYAADCIRVNSMGYNLIGNIANCDFVSNTGDIININPELAALRNNGGPTFTHALLPGSPAIDAGNPAGCTDQDGNLLTTDQRGVIRPQGTACDIGAFELEVAVVDQVLDDFNRVDGPIGENWIRYTSKYRILNNQLRVRSSGSNTDIYWHEAFGADQEAFVTFKNINKFAVEQNLLLKAQSNQTWGDGVLEVLYDGPGHNVQVWTWEWPQGWVKYGDDIPATFKVGDTLKARARADGIVEVYRNGELLGTRDVTGWSHYADGGYIGLWFIGAEGTLLDDFGGGTLAD